VNLKDLLTLNVYLSIHYTGTKFARICVKNKEFCCTSTVLLCKNVSKRRNSGSREIFFCILQQTAELPVPHFCLVVNDPYGDYGNPNAVKMPNNL
jgi:hypothetical protein